MIPGAHVSSAAPLAACVERAQTIGAEAIQIFNSSPRSWRQTNHSEQSLEALRARVQDDGIEHFFVHGCYLINLATADPELLNKSVTSLAASLRFCETTGAKGVIFHTGSHKGSGFDAVIGQVAASVQAAIAAAPGNAWVILENSAAQGGTVGGRLSELGAIIREAGSERVRVCIDTCHAYAAGYDIPSPEGCAAFLEEFDREIGLDRLVAVHANDSKAGLGSGLDRHENIGEGQIGRAGFRVIMSRPEFRRLPFILEVPGYSKDGPDAPNVEMLKVIAAEAEVMD